MHANAIAFIPLLVLALFLTILYEKTNNLLAPIAARQTKRLMTLADQPLEIPAHLDLENQLVVAALGSEDGTEAIRAMMTGEQPTFTGR